MEAFSNKYLTDYYRDYCIHGIRDRKISTYMMIIARQLVSVDIVCGH